MFENAKYFAHFYQSHVDDQVAKLEGWVDSLKSDLAEAMAKIEALERRVEAQRVVNQCQMRENEAARRLIALNGI
jgi:hypothetical protein